MLQNKFAKSTAHFVPLGVQNENFSKEKKRFILRDTEKEV